MINSEDKWIFNGKKKYAPLGTVITVAYNNPFPMIKGVKYMFNREDKVQFTNGTEIYKGTIVHTGFNGTGVLAVLRQDGHEDQREIVFEFTEDGRLNEHMPIQLSLQVL